MGGPCSSDGGCLAGLLCVGDRCAATPGPVGAGCYQPSACHSGICGDDLTCQCIAIFDHGCTTSADCCKGGICDVNGACRIPAGGPRGLDGGCAIGLTCVQGVCSRPQCVSDGGACSLKSPCCSGACRRGFCPFAS